MPRRSDVKMWIHSCPPGGGIGWLDGITGSVDRHWFSCGRDLLVAHVLENGYLVMYINEE